MKTLKKVLSVALVLAMALSLVTLVGAANVSKYQDFTDADAIVNKEAVDTLVGLRVLDGLEDGSFGPEGYLTRAQAAAIIARLLLGRTVADGMVATTAPFADVPANHWAAKYIQYCVSRGIINGMGDNTFVPNGEVTAAQFAKMLLVAAGYGKKGEYVGADWAINAIVDAQNLGILDTNVDYMAPATRDLIARYAFNFYTKVAFVSYSKDIEDYVKKTVKRSGSDVEVTLAVQQGVAYVGPVKYINGVASRTWGRNNVALTGNYWPIGDVRILYSGIYVTGVTAFDRLNLSYEDEIRVLVNGTGTTHTGEDAVTNALAAANTASGTGTEFAFIDEDNDNKVDVISIIKKSAVKLTTDVSVAPNGKVTIVGNYPSGAKQIKGVDKVKVDGYEVLKKGDVMLYYYDAELDVYFVEKATAMTAVVSKVKLGVDGSTIGLTVNGTEYKPYAAALSPVNYLGNVALSRANVIYLDSNNYVVFVEPATDAPTAVSYGLVLNYAEGKNAFGVRTGTDAVRILKEDGTIAVYNTTYERTPVFDLSDTGADTLPAIVSYAVNDSGEITLYKPAAAQLKSGVVGPKDESTGYAKGSNTLAVTVSEIDTKYYLTSGTKVFYYKEVDGVPVYKAVTGYANTTAVARGESVVVYSANENTVADVVFFGVAPATPPTTKYAFTPAKLNWATRVMVGTTEYREAPAYVGDEVITIAAKKSIIESLGATGENMKVVDKDKVGVFAYQVDKDGYVTALSFSDDRIITPNSGDEKVTFVTDGYLLYGSSHVLFTSADTKFYRYDEDSKSVVPDTIAASVDDVITYQIIGVILDNNPVATNRKAEQVYFKIVLPTTEP